jgi:hypothetical protein
MDDLNELRLKIAKLKGYTFWDTPDKLGPFAKHFAWGKPREVSYAGGIPMYEVENPVNPTWSDDDPDWPRDIAAAWGLWDEMVAAERYPTLHSGPDDNHGGEVVYQVVLVNPYQECPFADAAPEAICRAYRAWQEAVQQAAQP